MTEPANGPTDGVTHRYLIQLATTNLDHDREIATITRAVGRKKWTLESSEQGSETSRGETVTVLTFVQTTRTKREPNAPVSASIVKNGASLPRRHR